MWIVPKKIHKLDSDHWMNIVINCCYICCPPDSSQCCVHWSKMFNCRVLIKWHNSFTGFSKEKQSNHCRWKWIYLYKYSLHVYVFVCQCKNIARQLYLHVLYVYVNSGFCVQYNYLKKLSCVGDFVPEENIISLLANFCDNDDICKMSSRSPSFRKNI